MKVWDAETGAELATLQAHSVSALSVAFSPDGKRLVSGGYDGSRQRERGVVKLWEAATGRELLVLGEHAHAVNGVAFSPDGQHVASSSSDKTVRLWRLADSGPTK